jgi:predicted nucleic acid-binding protein
MTDRGGNDNARKIAYVDASALVALADRGDASHQAAVSAYRDLIASEFHLFTTDIALTSAHELLLAALGGELARTWLAQCGIAVECATPNDVEVGRRTIEEGLTARHATLAETIQLAVLDRLGVTDVFAVDRAFLAMLG